MSTEPSEPGGPLAGIRVVAIEQSVAGPLASRVLADMGADVVKVEPPQGDFARRWDSHVHGESSHFVWLNRRKRSVVLSLRDPADRATLERLLAAADVLIFNMAVAAAERAGLTRERLRAEHPALVVCQVSGYGSTGPARDRKAYDMLLQAETGILDLTGDDSGPVRLGVSLCDIGTGLYAASVVLAALFERSRTGDGRFLDLSMFEAMTEFTGPNLTAFANAGVRYQRNRLRHHSIVPYGIFGSSDGFLAIAIEHDADWRVFCERVLDRPDLAADPAFFTNELRVGRRSDVEATVEAAFGARSAAEWRSRLDAAGIAYGVINDIEAVWNHPVEHALGLHGEARLQDGTPVSVPRSPAERAFGRTAATRVPGLDADRDYVL